VKSYKTFHIFRVTAFNAGEALYGGNNENLDGSPHVFEMHKNIFIPKDKMEAYNNILALPAVYSIPKRDSFYHELAIEAWKTDPVQQIGVIPEKLAKNWLLPGMFDIYTNDTTKTRGLQLSKLLSIKYFNNVWYAPYKHLLYMVIHWALLLLVVWGILRLKKQNRFQLAVFILLLFYLLYTIPFCGLPRFHVALFPLLIIAFTPLPVILKINKILSRIQARSIKP
ncbi:MAG TPA: hypothetical protein VK808_11330, partial [Bacteroidia bacterium]|nr:hypothetical protein [Bacteroidia bacterium]